MPQPQSNISGKIIVILVSFTIVLSLLMYNARDNETLSEIVNSPLRIPSISPTQQPKQSLPQYKQAEKAKILPGAKWVPQTFNNCAPATTSMILQYFGHNVSQEETRKALRTNPTDSNVFTPEIQHYLKQNYNIESKLMYNGNLDILKTLITNGFYIMVEDWLHPNDDVGHNTIIRGYDDDRRVLISDDSFIGVNISYPYEVFDEQQWKSFNREYLVVYRKDQEPLVQAILGEQWDPTVMYQNSVKRNQEDTRKNPRDVYAWFNLGTSYYALSEYHEARAAFEQARSIGWSPRMLWYQYQPVQTYNQLGEYQKALELAAEGLRNNDSYAELHLEAAIAYKGLGQISRAKEEVGKALSFAPNLEAAQKFAQSLK